MENLARGTPVRPFSPKRILLAMEPMHPPRAALAWALELGTWLGAAVDVVTVVARPKELTYFPERGAPAFHLDSDRLGRAVLDDCIRAFEHQGIEPDFAVLDGDPAKAVLARAAETEADLIIVGSHDRGPAQRLLVGSLGDYVNHHAQASVLVARQPPPVRDPLLAIDGSLESRYGAAFGIALARRYRTEAHLMHTVDVPRFSGTKYAMEWKRRDSEWLALDRWVAPDVLVEMDTGPVGRTIVRSAGLQNSNFIVLGSHGGRKGKPGRVGRIGDSVGHHAHTCSVLTVKRA